MISTGRGADVIAAMRQVSPIDVCLLIDDVHQLGGPASNGVLGEVIRHLPSNGHIVLRGRAKADIPLARLRVTGDCVEISEHELAFTPAEERNLARLLDVQPPRRELAGWPALVRLALTSQRTLAQQFLWEEIVGALQPMEARALLALALIGSTPCPDCGAAAEITERFALLSTDGPIAHVALSCVEGHHFRMAADRLPTHTVFQHGPRPRTVQLCIHCREASAAMLSNFQAYRAEGSRQRTER